MSCLNQFCGGVRLKKVFCKKLANFHCVFLFVVQFPVWYPHDNDPRRVSITAICLLLTQLPPLHTQPSYSCQYNELLFANNFCLFIHSPLLLNSLCCLGKYSRGIDILLYFFNPFLFKRTKAPWVAETS